LLTHRKDPSHEPLQGNLRDIEFNLFEVFGRGEVLGQGPYADLDADTAREMLKEVARLSENELAASFVDADRNPPVLRPATQARDDARVLRQELPGVCRRASGASMSRGARRHRRPAVPEVGHERMVLGANPAIAMFAASYAFARLLYVLGTDDQKKLAPHIIENGWHCTMVLTEPDAGSDVGAGRTKADQNEDGTWNITGVKRFITSGESDMVDNVVHFVLARPEGAGAGTKGLSLFIVPKFHVDLETGELGERNGA
jgi:alkylation response protein AidB-like acyl-CoA dehydrogenase